MATIISIVSGAFAPSLAFLSFIYLKDKYEPEPLKILIKMFVLGFTLVFPAYVLERTFQEGMNSFFWYSSDINIAIIEEFLKWFTLYYMMYKNIEFNEPYDGIVYSVSIAMGFATLENIGYLFYNTKELSFVILRSLLPVSGHALFGVIMGYFMGQAKFSNMKNEKKLLLLSFTIPIFLHSTYNFILTQKFASWINLMIPFLIVLWWYGLKKINIANNDSPLKKTYDAKNFN